MDRAYQRCSDTHDVHHMDPRAYNILEAGALFIQRTEKSYLRCTIDLTLEQTVNRDAASPMNGISALETLRVPS